MSNALTGDFEAVLELSGGTLNRLLATMHQNAFANAGKPSFPHVSYFRIGDNRRVLGVRGSVAAQIGVPHVELIHGATDRFRLHVGVRARYRADPGSTPLADIIHGTVWAVYQFEDIDPGCFGWRGIAANYLWMRVIKDSVSFDGTLRNESSVLSIIGVLDEQVVKARVDELLATLLDTTFAPPPQPISKQFRHLRSLAFGGGPGQSGIAVPLGLRGEEPTGSLAGINNLFLEGHDFGIAVSKEFVLSSIQPKLAPIVGLQRDFHVHGDAGVGGGLEIDYHVRLDSATAEWAGPLVMPFVSLSGGLIRIRLSGVGWASRLYRSGVFNVGSVSARDLRMSFTVEQLLLLGFDGPSERLTVTTFGTPAVSLNYNGPFSGTISPLARATIATQLQSNLAGAVTQAQNDLAFLTAPGRKAALIDQLRVIDDAAGARFTEAVFQGEGLILRGTIPLSYRHRPHVSFEKTAAVDGFNAIESWIPGGRVDSFEWTWRWFTNGIEAPPGPPGSSSQDDTFTLRRPPGSRGRFGVSLSREQPLPGLDGQGRMCLLVRGVHVDQVTGALVPVESVRECAQFGYEFRMPYEVGAYTRICDPLRAVGERRAPEIGLMRVGVPEVRDHPSNTLVLYLGDAWNADAAGALQAGLERSRREGAGLLVLVLFRDGALRDFDPELQSRLAELGEGLAAPMLVSEDVRGAWSTVLALPTRTSEPVWRLITPEGVVRWAHHGRADAELLASVLDERLVTSGPPGLGRIRPGIDIADLVPIELVTGHCPPVPLSRLGTSGSKLVFVHKDSAAAVALPARPWRDQADRVEDAPYLAIVVEGANADEAEALRKSWKLNIPTFPDQHGTLTRGAGVRFSPATLTLDDRGRLVGYELGVELGDHGSVSPGGGYETQEEL